MREPGKAAGTGRGSAASPQPPACLRGPTGSPRLCLASKQLHSCASEQPLGRCLGSPRGRCSCFGTDAPQPLPAEGWRVPGGCSGAAQGIWAPSLGRLQSAGTYHHLVALQPSAGGGGGGCAGLILSRGLGWARTRGLWGRSELGLETRGHCPHPALASDPQRSLEQPNVERKMALLWVASPPRALAMPRWCHSGYHGAEQGSGAPCVGWVMGRGSVHATGSRRRLGPVVGDSVASFSAWPGREAPGFGEGERHG